jgi:hypothetical protein
MQDTNWSLVLGHLSPQMAIKGLLLQTIKTHANPARTPTRLQARTFFRPMRFASFPIGIATRNTKYQCQEPKPHNMQEALQIWYSIENPFPSPHKSELSLYRLNLAAVPCVPCVIRAVI